uniref:Uncharacterized protein n=1 Tax=Cucumis melo TaxID=3656 RepID=A0A9I9E587_CUCME
DTEGNYIKGKVYPQHKDKGEDKRQTGYRSDLQSPRIYHELRQRSPTGRKTKETVR